MAEALAGKTCTPCRGGVPPLTREQAEIFHAQAPDWQLSEDAHHIERSFRFLNFREAMVGPDGSHRGGSTGQCAIADGHLGHCPRVDGDRVSTERSPVWSNALPVHGSLLPRDGGSGGDRRRRNCASEPLWLARARRFHSWWRVCHLVGHRASVGQVLDAPGHRLAYRQKTRAPEWGPSLFQRH